MPKKIETEARASLKTCRALINRIEAGLSAEELIVDVSSAGELLFYLEFAASVLEKSAPRPRKRGQTAAEDRLTACPHADDALACVWPAPGLDDTRLSKSGLSNSIGLR